MISINGNSLSGEFIITEAYRKHNREWIKALIVKLPKSDYTMRQALDLVDGAKTISETTDLTVITHYVDGVVLAQEDDGFNYVWLREVNNVRAENLETRTVELEQQVTDLELDNIEAQQYITELELAILEGGMTNE